MFRKIKTLVLLGGLASGLLAQSRQEVIEYIVRELKSCDNDQAEFKEVEFSDAWNTCKLRVTSPGQASEKTLEMTLADVDVFTRVKRVRLSSNETVEVFSLVATSRGRSPGLKRDHLPRTGPEVILHDLPNETKVRGLEAAFTYLAELTTSKPRIFRRKDNGR